MQNVGFGLAGLVLADVLESGRRAVVTVRDDHLVLDQQGAYLPADAVGVFGPDPGHFDVTNVELTLFFFLVSHKKMSCMPFQFLFDVNFQQFSLSGQRYLLDAGRYQ